MRDSASGRGGKSIVGKGRLVHRLIDILYLDAK